MHHKVEITDLEPTADQSETTLAVETHLNAEVSQLSWQDIARIVNRFMFVFACLFTVLIYLRFFFSMATLGLVCKMNRADALHI